MPKELPKVYEPQQYEDKIYKTWEESGFFNPDKLDLPADAPSYTIILPPPNITDKLHLGHSAMLAIEDLMIRYRRMSGFRALWVPGTDHAAIATQNVVEKKLLKEEGKTRHDLGREKFLAKVWEFLKETQGTILYQTRKMGASLDWSRQAFTLDEQREKAVKKMFVDMYQAGAIYRGERIVNWCPRCHSTLADDEVEYKAQAAKLYTFRYSKDFPFTIATTRPETKLGDTAVAVNLKDERYQDYIGKTYEVDFVGMPLRLKVIADWQVDQEFGTGALGVTPAHSMVDWQMAQANDLPIIKVIDEDGKIFDGFKEYSGKTAIEAREMVVARLREEGLLEKEEEIENNLSLCYRCGTPIEPLMSKQWFVDVEKKLERLGGQSLKAKAMAVAETEKIKFIPERFKKRYLDWMTNLHDWCISRQIWFGHRIPVWYKKAEQPIGISYFVHGTTVDNENKKASGHADVELSQLGIEQSKKLNDLVKGQKFDVIFCSDLKRAVDSAEISFGDRKIKIIKDKRLRECDYGDMTQGSSEEVEKIEKNLIYKPFTNGESYQDVENRAKNFLNDLIEKYQGKKIAIVAHKGPQLALDVLINNKTWEQAFDEDWRKKKAWQPGWNYELKEINYVGEIPPKGTGWEQDPDTLDTWFSSGMWTFSTLGWPDNFVGGKKTGDLAKFHPTQVLETGYEIITLWVSRMIIMSFFALGEIPFENVYLHGMVLDQNGKKMSKSKGNGIDPLDVIEKYGTDAVRLSLLVGSTPGNDVRISEEKIAGFRNFVNKLWNVSRYIIGNYDLPAQAGLAITNYNDIKDRNLTEADNWILWKMHLLIRKVIDDISNYNFSQAGESLRNFTWDDLADWYLEVCKFEKNEEKKNVLSIVLKDLLKLWHPFIPFVTEVIWQEIGSEKLLMIEKWPDEKDYAKLRKTIDVNAGEASKFDLIADVVKVIRNARAENKVEPAKKIKAVIYAGEKREILEKQSVLIKSLRTGIEELEIKENGEKISDAIFATVAGMEIYLIGAVDKDKEKARLKKEISKLEDACVNIVSKLTNNEFADRAPENIVKQEKDRLAQYREELEKLKERLKKI